MQTLLANSFSIFCDMFDIAGHIFLIITDTDKYRISQCIVFGPTTTLQL